VPNGASPMEKWKNKIRHLRSYLRGWAKNMSSVYKSKKVRHISITDTLELKAKTTLLSDNERGCLKNANEELANLRRVEETKWARRAKVKHVQKGGNNTKYFHLVANGKHIKNKIFQLEQDEGTVVGQDNLKTYISEYYKNLFGEPAPNNFSMIETKIDDIPQLSGEENRILTSGFTEKEIHDAIMPMEKNKASGPDGFSVEFYQHCWETIKYDLMAMFSAFQRGELPLFQLNFGTIILLPKKENSIQIQQYRPICLLNVSFKIFTKVGTNRISEVAHTVLRPTQTAFMPGRHILEGVVVLH
jgi:hypothetical protein